MNKHYSLGGEMLRVNLTLGKVSKEPTFKFAKKFLGGRGINWWRLYNDIKPNVTPFEPENEIIFGSGLLVGTLAPCAARLSVDSKNPFSGGIASSNSGGHFAAELKFSGYDQVIFQGRSRKPVYLWIDDSQIELRDASNLWGCTTCEADERIKEEVGDKEVNVAAIGPAGEKLVRMACIIANRERAAGKCGLGAVMGSKNLKAVAVRGTGSIEVNDPDRFIEAVDNSWERIKHSDIYEPMKKFGTFGIDYQDGYLGPVKNYQDEYLDKKFMRKINSEILHSDYEAGAFSCFVCPLHCSHFYKVKEGSYKGTCEKLEAQTISNFGTNLYIDYPPALIKAVSLCNEYGLDMDVSSEIGWAFECYQRGILTEKDTDGLELKWGNHEVVMKLLRKIAYREGFGNILAEGVMRASQNIGRGSEKYASYIKGMGNRETMRASKGWALGIAVALRGGGHTSAGPFMEPSPTLYEDKPELVVYCERLHAVLDSLGICLYCGVCNGPNLLNPEEKTSLIDLKTCADLVSAATGWNITKEQLLLIGEQILNVGKAFNVIHAKLNRRDDYPPKRLMKEPIKSGPQKGERLEKVKWDKMLDRYYELHGWDVKTGLPTKKGLMEIGLLNIA